MDTLSLVITIQLLTAVALAGEYTFELLDKEKMCFYEELEAGVACDLEFQVIQGGNYDCDMELKAPSGLSLYKDVKKQYDSVQWTTKEKGAYEFCFSNEFSTFTHKTVYFEIQIGEEPPLKPDMAQAQAMTLMETSSVGIHQSLKTIEDYQTHHRLREVAGRSHAEDLNSRVMFNSLVEFTAVFIIGLVQVLIVRSFFSDRKNRGQI